MAQRIDDSGGSAVTAIEPRTTDFTEGTATDAVVASFADTADPRLRNIMQSLTRHLHAFVREIEPTHTEWDVAVDFLTRTGHMCDDVRQEFILMSDVMGVSMLVDAINNRKPVGVTESTVLGPFHVVDSPVRVLGDRINEVSLGEECVVRGRVVDPSGIPIAAATVDIWQADADGFYDVQKDDTPNRDLRGLFTTDIGGRYWFRSIVPRYYPIPDDGPVGELLDATGRHPYRPAHIHVIAGAPGFSPVTTHLFIEGSPYLADDTVFGVKRSLVRGVRTIDDANQATTYDIANPFSMIEFDVVLNPAPVA